MNKTQSIRRAMLTAVCLGTFACTVQAADDYPSKQIRMVLPNSPGSLVDIVARVISDPLGKRLGKTIYIDNLPGAGGTTGTDQIARAPKDGYTIGMVSSNYVINPSLYKLPFDIAKDLATVSVVGTSPMALVLSPKVQAADLKALLADAKARPGALTFGSAGIGTVGHLAGELMEHDSGTKLLHIPYKGQNAFTTDVIGGQVDAGFFTAAVAAPFVKSGKLRAIGVTSSRRSESLPGVPTFEEAGLRGYDVETFVAVIAPSGLPAPVLTKLHEEIQKVLQLPEVRAKLREQAVDVVQESQAQSARRVDADIARFAKVIKDAGVRVD